MGKEGLEPSPRKRHDPKSCASASSAIPPLNLWHYSQGDQTLQGQVTLQPDPVILAFTFRDLRQNRVDHHLRELK